MVLVVDDQPSACIVLKKLFETEGLPTECQTDPDEALDYMRAVKPAVVILDHMMPGKSGLDVFKEMRADPALQNVPVIFFSAAEGEDRSKALEMGAAGWLVKGSVGWVDLLSKVLEVNPGDVH